MTEIIQLAEDAKVILEQNKIANTLHEQFPALKEFNDHSSISTIRTNFSLTETFHFGPVSETKVVEL